MQQLTQFVSQHWLLVTAFIVVLILIFIEEMRSSSAGGKRVSPQELTYYLNREGAQVIDIREANQFRDGHIAGSKNISAADIDQQLTRLGEQDKDVIVVAGSQPQKAQVVAHKLRKAGFTKVHQLNGGISAWKNANLPLIKGK